MLTSVGEVEARRPSLYLPSAPRGDRRLASRCFAGQRASIPSCWPSESNRRGGLRDHRERLSEAGMVDLLGMFRRRPAKRNPPGFARSRADITALGDSMGDMLNGPVRDAPPIARETPLPKLPAAAPPAEKPNPPRAKN